MLRAIGSQSESQYEYVQDGVAYKVIARLYPLVDPNLGEPDREALGVSRDQSWLMLRSVLHARFVDLAPTVLIQNQEVSQFASSKLPGTALTDEEWSLVRTSLDDIVRAVKADNLAATLDDLSVALVAQLTATPLVLAAQTRVVVVLDALLGALYADQSIIIPAFVFSDDLAAAVRQAFTIGLVTTAQVISNETILQSL